MSMGLAFLGGLSDPQASAGGLTLVLGLLSDFLACCAWKRSSIVEYQLFLMTSSQEAQAIASQDGGMIEALRRRIESAMAGQLAA